MTKELKACPFCGGEARIQLTDGEGNAQSESYLKNPDNGVGYVIVHDLSDAIGWCPLATDFDVILGNYIYFSEQDALDAWNKRFNNDSNEEDF